MINYIFNHSYYLIIILVFAIWFPTWSLPYEYGFNSVNEGYLNADLNQYNTITFISYPIILDKMSKVRKYSITFSSMLSISKYTILIIFEKKSKQKYHDELKKILTSKFDEKRIFFISNDDQFDTDYELFLSEFSSKVIAQVRTKYACYINANVVVDPYWYDRVSALLNAYFDDEENTRIYLTGKRIQIPLSSSEIKEFTIYSANSKNSFFKSLRKLIRSKKDDASCIKQCESDYFITTVDPSAFDLRYLADLKLTGGFFTMYLNYMAERNGNCFNLNEKVPVYYLGTLPDIDDPEYVKDSQYNYDIILNNSYHISKNSDISKTYDGKHFQYKWYEKEIQSSTLTTLLNKKMNCSSKTDIANIKLTKFETVDYHTNQEDQFGNFRGFNQDWQNPNDENENENKIEEENMTETNDDIFNEKKNNDSKEKKDNDSNENTL